MILAARGAARTATVAVDRFFTGGTTRVGYIGGHGGGNLGDDLMMDLARGLFSEWRLVDCAESWHEKRLARLGLSGHRYFGHVLLGGGTLISPFWFGKVEAAIEQGVPVSSLGTGAGSCGFIQPDGIDLSEWAPLLKRFANLGVRGPRSLATLQKLGVENAQVVGDLALTLTQDEPTQASETPAVAVNLSMPASGDPQHGEADRFAELMRTLMPYVKQGWKVKPYAMHPIDVGITRELSERLGGDDVQVPHLSSVEQFFDYIGPATLNVAVRLHGAILGCCVGVPPVMLGYRDKCMDFAESLSMPEACVYLPNATTGDVAYAVSSAIENAKEERALVITRAQKLRNRLRAYARRILSDK